MIKGLGIDIIDNKKFLKMPYPRHKNFYNRIFTATEIKYCLAKAHPERHFATRFAAKEAFIKAADLKIADMKKIKIKNKKNGAPEIIFKNFGKKILVSVSHADETAAAVVIIC